jgi:predicted negative regulator of RcsB-dependent stress response
MASSSTVARSRQPQSALNSDDAMALRAAELAAWARRNARLVIGIASVAVLLVGGVLVWKYTQAQRRAAAAERFMVITANPATQTASGTRELENFIQQYSGTAEADEARILLAQIRLNGGNARQAIAPLTEVAGSRSPLAPQAAMMLGSAHAQAGDRAAAVRAYEQAAERSPLEYQKFEALGQAALQHEQGGNYAAAAEIYQRMLNDAEPNSAQESVIQMRLTEARAHVAPR